MPTLFPLRLMLPMLLIIAGNLSAEPPKVFNELADGVADARDGKRLLLFLLVENFAPESDAILTAVNDELANRGSEFTIVRCRNESADHRQLFQERFKQDPSKMPLGVIATPTGEVVTGTNGKVPEAYRLMIRAARVQGGLEKDPKQIAAIRAELAEGSEELTRTIFGIKKGEVMTQKVVLIESREWTFENGVKERAALLEANGATGIFIKADGSEVEWNFNDLSAADKAFLSQKLSSK